VPLYEYECKSCHHRFEKIQKFSDPMVTTCPDCGQENSVEQLLSAPAVQFKGSGWYVTDYAKKSSSQGSSGASSNSESRNSESSSSAKSDSKPAESKSDSKPASSSNSKDTSK
jgi:putative FmdB family regulatory protein